MKNTDQIKDQKESWFLGCFSMIVPGLGQIVGKRYAEGIAFLFAYCLFNVLGIYVLISERFLGIIPGFIILGMAAAMPLISAILAGRSWRRANGTNGETNKAWFAVFLTYLIPGLGYLYFKRYWFFGIWLAATMAVAFLAGDMFNTVLNESFGIVVLIHVMCIGFKNPRMEGRKLLFLALAIVSISVHSFLSGPLKDRYAFLTGYDDGACMEPLVPDGSYSIINNFAYWFDEPKLNDIVVFRTPQSVLLVNPECHKILTKRIVAEGGETVKIANSQIQITGKISRVIAIPEPNSSEQVSRWKYFEGKTYEIPQEHYFVMGDNVYDSYDSRAYGPIHRRAILGRKVKICWPLKDARILK